MVENISNGKNKENEYWYPGEVRPYIIEELKTRFPDSIIIPEFGRVDIMVLMEDDNIPVEIQKIYAKNDGKLLISRFEQDTRKQVEENIDISGKCWLFLDAKFLEHLGDNSNKQITLNMKWLYKYYKEGTMKIFSITRGGIIKELKDNDLDILTKFTITELDKARNKIAYKVLKWKGFTTDEINMMHNSYHKDTGYNDIVKWSLTEGNGREKEYGHIRNILGRLDGINDILNCQSNRQGSNKDRDYVQRCYSLGIFVRNGGYSNDKDTRINFVDEAGIAQYFDGYKNNKELWEYIRIHSVDTRTFYTIIRGEYANFLRDRKNQKNIDDAWN